MDELLKCFEVDGLLRLPSGRAKRYALRGLIPHITLPDGEILFFHKDIETWLKGLVTPSEVDRDAT